MFVSNPYYHLNDIREKPNIHINHLNNIISNYNLSLDSIHPVEKEENIFDASNKKEQNIGVKEKKENEEKKDDLKIKNIEKERK